MNHEWISSFFDLCYSETTCLSIGEFLIDSSEGAQQGDPLAVFLFCLAINNILQTLISNFKSGYVDDISIGDVMWQNVLKDLEMVMTEGVKIGMELNLKNKSELIVFCDDARERDSIILSFLAVFPHITITEPTDLVLLGAPIGENAQEAVVNEKLDELSRMCSRLRSLPSHVAFFLLKNCFYIPKLMYILRTSTLFLKTTSLHRFDECIRNTLQAIFNVMIDDPRWELMTLPCKLGGMGIMQVPKLAIAAYASSVFSTLDICNTIYASEPTTETLIQDAIQRWRNNVSTDVPLPERKYKQKKWSLPMMLQQAELLKDSGDSARLNGLMCPRAADWLNALPSRSLALQLSDDEFRIAIGFRLGAPVCTPHKCSCGDIVDSYGKHALVCKKSRSVHARHSMGNHIIHRAFIQANIPSTLEPQGLFRSDRKRPDGLTLVPWSHGRALAWDFTCVHRLASSYTQLAGKEGPTVADAAETRKRSKYESISESHIFQPVAIETLGGLGTDTLRFVTSLGKRITQATGDDRATLFLRQRLGIAVQRGTAACVRETLVVEFDDPIGADFRR